jgi:uncharacterized membrane protein
VQLIEVSNKQNEKQRIYPNLMPSKLNYLRIKRHNSVDLLRSIAIILMLVFHFLYDLNFLNLADFDIAGGQYWIIFRGVIVSFFLIAMGASLTLAYPGKIIWKNFFNRQFTLALRALVISLITYVVIKENWVFFGIIHFIFVASILAIGFRHSPIKSLFIFIAIISVYYFELLHKRWPFNFIEALLPHKTNDFVALFPWLALPFLGIYLANLICLNNEQAKSIKLPGLLTWISKHSLLIYLLHQPVFFILLYVFIEIFSF